MVLRENRGAGGFPLLGDAGMDGFPKCLVPSWLDGGLAGGFGLSPGDGNDPTSLRALGNMSHAGGSPASHAGADFPAYLDRELLVFKVAAVTPRCASLTQGMALSQNLI